MPQWIQWSFVAMFVLVMLDLLYRKFIADGYGALELTMYPLFLSSLIALAYIMMYRPKMKEIDKKDVVPWMLAGVLFLAAFYMLRKAQGSAPNIGFVNAIVYSSVAITVISTALIYKDQLEIQQIVGTILVVCGIGLMTLHQKAIKPK
jgi:drug/metabolite transporter (DMT)-like permease